MTKKVLLIVGQAILLTACATNSKEDKIVNLDTIENEQTIKLNVGQQLKFEVSANPSTGYDWFTTEPENCNIKIINKSTVENQNDGTVGSPLKNVYTVMAGDKGECTIQFDYKRSWETVAPSNTKKINFIVK